MTLLSDFDNGTPGRVTLQKHFWLMLVHYIAYYSFFLISVTTAVIVLRIHWDFFMSISPTGRTDKE